MKKMKAIDLFSGSGGLSLGLKQAGFSVVGAVEVDPLAIEIYSSNHPEVKLWRQDIRMLKVDTVKRELGLRKGELDLLAGCPPCQGFSTMKTLNGARNIDDARNDLLFEFLRFVKELSPKTIMMENVPGLHTDDRISIFTRELESMGYKCNRDILDASDYGVPQRRKRMILIAGKSRFIEFGKKTSPKLTVRNAIEKLPPSGKSGDPLHDLKENRTTKVINLIKAIPHDGGSRKDLGPEKQLKCHQKCDGFKDVYGRMAWDKVSPTITGGCVNPSKGRFLHPNQDRAITLREAALLQTFPNDYYFPADKAKHTLAVHIGNALPPEFIKRHATMIKNVLVS